MNHLQEKSFNSWNESDDLDVFEATRYFSGAIDGTGLQVGGFGSHGAVTVEDRMPSSVQKGNLDERLISSSSSLMKDKKCKQPSSPGARLVGLLNSFLHQAASGRKLKCLNPTSTTREPPEEGDAKEENSLGGRERRRSISRSQSTNSTGSKSSKFCGSSSFTNPDLYPYNYRTTPSISYKCNRGQKSVTFCPRIEAWRSTSITELLHNSGVQKEKDYGLHGIRTEERDAHDRENKKWVLNDPGDQYPGRDWFGDYDLPLPGVRKNSIRGEEEEEEEVSDSSSDLFELNICDHAVLSDGLPVFATTDIEVINRASTAS
ncbi:protein BIG GRAIN 1-like E [Musa acuminata AAA Group]|uniref:protein BIG GRAIN 1-like E n=1 Tax=Musa acuminata AAA Group TaxID=214697 RepID=UPI0031E3C1E4